MQVVPYRFDGQDVRAWQDASGELRVVAADVCAVLGVQNPSDALKRLDADEKGLASIDTRGGKQEVAIVNESGLYSLILGSRKPQAKEFKRWVTHEVLPTIRRTGSYNPVSKPSAETPANLQGQDNAWLGQSIRNAQALIQMAQASLGAEARKQMPGVSSPDIAMGLAGMILQRQRLVMEFADLHQPTVRWLRPHVLEVDTKQGGWAEDMMKNLSREQLAEVLRAAATLMI